MKHFTIVFVVALFAFVGNVSGQVYIDEDRNLSSMPDTPFSGDFTKTITKAYKVHREISNSSFFWRSFSNSIPD